MPDAAVERLARIDCCALSDALDKLKLTGVVSGLPRLSGSGRIAGRAVTMRAGVVADGPVRDVDEARGYGFPIFARGCTARTARGRIDHRAGCY